MDYKVNDDCQAVDEVGRWENGRIKGINDDGNITVTFPGWSSDYDVTLPQNSPFIRNFIRADYCDSDNKRRRPFPSPAIMAELRQLCEGDEVKFRDGEGKTQVGECKIVDRFKRIITLENGTSILAEKIVVATEEEPAKRTRKRRIPDPGASPHAADNEPQQCESTTTPAEKERYGPVPGIVVGENVVCLGQDVSFPGTGCHFIATTIFGGSENNAVETGEVSGPLLTGDGGVMPGMTVTCTLPLEGIQIGKPTGISKDGRRKVDEMISATTDDYISTLRGCTWRHRYLIRKNQLAIFIRNEIKEALKNKITVRVINLGPLQRDIDSDLFGLSTTANKAVYSYRENNIDSIDSLLGKRWDVLPLPDCFFRCVTELSFRQDVNGVGKVTVKTARLEGHLPSEYRQFIQNRITISRCDDE